MVVLKTSDHIKIKVKMPNPSQGPPSSSKAPNQDLMDMDVLCTFKIKIESQNLEHEYIIDWCPYPNQEPSDPIKAPNQGLKEMDGLCTFKIKIESQNLEHRCSKDQ